MDIWSCVKVGLIILAANLAILFIWWRYFYTPSIDTKKKKSGEISTQARVRAPNETRRKRLNLFYLILLLVLTNMPIAYLFIEPLGFYH